MLGGGHESLLVLVLVALAVIILCGRLSGNVALRVGQPRAVGEIVGGILLGVLLTLMWSGAAPLLHGNVGLVLNMLAQIGIVLMMFQVGMEFDFALLRGARLKRAIGWISVVGMLVPYAVGMGCAWWYHQYQPVDNLLGLMLVSGVAFSITALPILGRILLERQMQHCEVGVTTIAAAGINDLLGWIALGAVIVLATGQTSQMILLQLVAVLLFLGVFFLVIRPLALRPALRIGRENSELCDSHLGLMVSGVFVVAVATALLGIFAVVGGFLAGTALYQCRDLLREWNRKVTPLVNVVLVPVFFFYTGMKVELGGLSSWQDLLWCLIWVVAACASKSIACTLGARLGGLGWEASLRIGALMNTRALMELVVLNVALDLGLIPPTLFSILVIMAMVSTLMTSPLLALITRVGARHRGEVNGEVHGETQGGVQAGAQEAPPRPLPGPNSASAGLSKHSAR